MRMLVAALSLNPLLLLAGCSAAEEGTLKAFRDQSIEGCVSASRQAAPAAMANFDWQRLCTCSTERIMQGKSASELLQLRPGSPEQREAVEQCAREMMPGGRLPGDQKAT